MKTYITSKEELKELVTNSVEQVLAKKLPSLLREITLKKYLTKTELQELTGWSSRTIQRLRDNRQIPFVQHGKKIIYPTNGIEDFFNTHRVETKLNN